MSPPESPSLKPIPFAVLSTALPESVTGGETGRGLPVGFNQPRIENANISPEICHAFLEPETIYPFFLSHLTAMTTEYATKLPTQFHTRQQKHRLGSDGEHKLGFTLSDGPWWYRILPVTRLAESEDRLDSARDCVDDLAERSAIKSVNQQIVMALEESATNAGPGKTGTYWQEWNSIASSFAFEKLIGEVALGVRWKNQEYIVLFIHTLQKKRDEHEFHFYLRKQAGLEKGQPAQQIQPTATTPTTKPGPISEGIDPITGRKRRLSVLKATNSPSVQEKYVDPFNLIQIKATKYVPPHRQQQQNLPSEHKSHQSSTGLDGTCLFGDDTINAAANVKGPPIGSFTPPAKKKKKSKEQIRKILFDPGAYK